MIIRAVIIDDEQGAREALEKTLQTFSSQVEIVGCADGVQAGFELIQNMLPDLVLLDIKMQDGTGFDLLKKFDKIGFKIIFITAYDAYALSAFKFSAVDYLLKPVEHNDLITAINKACEALEHNILNLKIKTLIHNIEKDNKKLTLRTSESFHIISINEIIRCEAQGNYTEFHLIDGTKVLVSNTLRDYEEILTPYNFFRVHQSHLLNLYQIARFDKKNGGIIIMKDKSNVPVSVRKKESLMDILENL